MYVGLLRFHEVFFGDVAGLETALETVFDKYREGDSLLFGPGDGWRGWPKDATQDDLKATIDGPTAQRKLDVGSVKDSSDGEKTQHIWSRILVPGKLKSNSSDDKPLKASADLGRYAREAFAAQDTCRFVLGFPLCGSLDLGTLSSWGDRV
ncbi:hypothetical protein V8C40DRAFT_263819 [Trichoderma camerunense]